MNTTARRHRREDARRPESERGTVLVIVMWSTMVLVTLALYFGHAMLVEYRASANSLGNAQAAQAIEGVRRYLYLVFDELTLPGDLPDAEEFIFEDLAVGDASVWVVGRGYAVTVQATEPTFGLIPENGKLDLNTASAAMIGLLPSIPEGLAERIVDWRDSNEQLTEGGAESQDYLIGNPSYYAKNADFESVEELRFVLQDAWDYFYGEDTNMNGVLDPNEDDGDATPPLDNQDGVLDAGILEYVTIYSQEPTTLGDGTERVDVTADNMRQSLRAILEENLDEDRAADIIQTLGSRSFTSVLQVYAASGMSPEEFALIDGYLYQPNPQDDDAPDGVVRGLVNVNAASAEVLTCVFQDEVIAAELVAYRETLDPTSLTSVAWVAEALEGDAAAIQAVGPLITGNCFVYMADLAAVGTLGRGYARVAYVLDTSGASTQVVYRRDRARLGWPLGETVRSESRTRTENRSLFQ